MMNSQIIVESLIHALVPAALSGLLKLGSRGRPPIRAPRAGARGGAPRNDEPQGIEAAGGGGVSALFREPDFQRDSLPRSVQASLSGHRGVPDIAYNGGVVGGVLVTLGFLGPAGIPAGSFFVFGGTSAGAPQWAGVVADVNQAAGRQVGFINKRLYKLGKMGVLAGLFHDVTLGDNGFCGTTTPDGKPGCVPGFSATPGWDLATGWGTPNFGTLGTVLGHSDDDDQGDFDDD